MIYLMALLFTFCSKSNQSIENNIHEVGKETKIKGDFVGYRDLIPIFSCIDSNVLYSIKKDKAEKYLRFPVNYRIFLINDKAIIYQDRISKEIVIQYSDSEVKIPYDNFINSLCSNDNSDSVFFESPIGELNLLNLPSQSIQKISQAAQYPKLGGGYLFFSYYSDSLNATPLSNLYKADPNHVENSSMVIKDQIHEEWNLISNGKYVICLINKDAKWLHAILNVSNGNIKYFNMPEKYVQNYFSNQSQSLIFYNQNDIMDYKVISIE